PVDARPRALCTVYGTGYGPLPGSAAYSNERRYRGVVRATTSNGIPIGGPSYRPEPKSGWSPVDTPIDAIICAESDATGSVSTRAFHGLFAGKIGQRGALGNRSACAEAPPTRSTPATRRTRRRIRPAA